MKFLLTMFTLALITACGYEIEDNRNLNNDNLDEDFTEEEFFSLDLSNSKSVTCSIECKKDVTAGRISGTTKSKSNFVFITDKNSNEEVQCSTRSFSKIRQKIREGYRDCKVEVASTFEIKTNQQKTVENNICCRSRA